MGRHLIYLALALLAGAVLNAQDGAEAAPADGFAPYQTILDRMPFGPVPPGFDPEAPPRTAAGRNGPDGAPGSPEAQQAEEEKRLAAAVRVSVLNVTPSGVVAVGFTDSSAQPPVHYYMKVGETRDAWTVKAADPAGQSVVLVKDGIEAELKVGEGTSGGGRGASAKGRAAPARGHVPMTLQAAPEPAAAAPSGAPAMSLRERLRARRLRTARDIQNEEAAAAKAKEAAARAEEERKAAAERDAAERAQQRETLLQIQEELRRTREAREAERRQQADAQESDAQQE